ncbi:hypothetical protein FUA48_02905 [Flavobacterium alkalisoli]|uniref:Uncharacterized protein n=1 Tax=Flavobacterium alkalisoli TaxID=2602769 RepID=A0A5B9FVA0_9FLAO|nr:hypothetical protein [Flavobacterium alkalisoli]QEE48557.1 hypothetical protein FUA48_02905 [Flavobacterium alkalisoli]
MKKFNLIIILLFVSFVGFAQSKFIEVVVNDTVSLEPVRFQVNVVAVEYDTVAFSEDYDPLVQQENNKNILQGIKAKLEKINIKLLRWTIRRQIFLVIISGAPVNKGGQFL